MKTASSRLSATGAPSPPAASRNKTQTLATADRVRAPKATKALLSRVPIAWPTLALAAVALAGFVTVLVAALSGSLSLAVALPLNTLFAFVTFTPMHDASHKAVGRAGLLNAVVGRLAALPLAAPFGAFRYVHLEHHKHTNETDGSDPDMYSGTGPRLLLPLRWLTQDLHYYVVYARNLRRHRRSEVVEVVLTLAAVYGTIAALGLSGLAVEVAFAWLLPARLAIGLLAFSFDYLPHAPYVATRKQDRYRATRVFEHRALTPLLLSQNYHLVHHLYPAVPWYRYGRVWFAKRAELLSKGAVAVRFRGR